MARGTSRVGILQGRLQVLESGPEHLPQDTRMGCNPPAKMAMPLSVPPEPTLRSTYRMLSMASPDRTTDREGSFLEITKAKSGKTNAESRLNSQKMKTI